MSPIFAMKPIGSVCRVSGGKRIPKGWVPSDTDTGYKYLRLNDFTDQGINVADMKFLPSDLSERLSRYRVASGDIIISVAGTLGMTRKITSDLDGAYLTENADRLSGFNGVLPDYILYVLTSEWREKLIVSSSTKSGQPKLALERIRNYSIPIPSLLVQNKIVEILTESDASIALAKTRMIHEEIEFHAIASRQFANHHAKYGSVRLNTYGSLLRGSGVTKNDLVDVEGSPCIRYAEIYTYYRDVADAFVSRLNETAVSGATPINNGDILFTSSGEKASEIGQALAYSGTEDAYCGGDLTIWRDHGQNAEYMAYQLNSYGLRKQKFRLAQGHSVVHLNAPEIAKLQLPFPPIEEQDAFASMANDYRKSRLLLAQQLEALKHQKRGLMQQLMTGKLRVKGAS